MSSAAPTSTDPRALPFETASWARRVLALIVDWALSILVVVFFIGWDAYTSPGGAKQVLVPVVYVVESALLTTLVGGSFGKLATRLRTVRVDGDPRPLDPLRAVARQLMVAVVIPPLIFRPDGRGVHDLSCGSATVTLQTYRTYFRRLAG
ncbi:RDD family protein [Nocardioides sp. BP30]|uniref:RDD family protein n=1 Tax=Nocardioides sp. BP30 TaxID=3036374 RepID=UPI002469C0B4|nr:RDD family protein [Nocardioides sp. BP30]WGL50966.1 RDD family protein [Nocardioides sp. BP30]